MNIQKSFTPQIIYQKLQSIASDNTKIPNKGDLGNYASCLKESSTKFLNTKIQKFSQILDTFLFNEPYSLRPTNDYSLSKRLANLLQDSINKTLTATGAGKQNLSAFLKDIVNSILNSNDIKQHDYNDQANKASKDLFEIIDSDANIDMSDLSLKNSYNDLLEAIKYTKSNFEMAEKINKQAESDQLRTIHEVLAKMAA